MMNENKKEITGLWMGFAKDFIEFFEMKAKIEENLGRVLTDNESHNLMVDYQKDKTRIEKLIINKNKGDVKAILTEHFNLLDLSKKKGKKECN